MLTTGKKLLDKASRSGYAVGAFNINNMEILQAVIRAAEKLKSPVILQTSEGAIRYAGLEMLFTMLRTAAERSPVPCAIHLDHGRDLDVIKRCIKIGYTSVMYDGSHLSFHKNITMTKRVVKLAHRKGISVEAELGTIGGAEDAINAREIILTDPNAAQTFIDQTGCDSLAVAIGTSHGAYKFLGAGTLDIQRLDAIRSRVPVPLVLHGASGVPHSLIQKARHYGAHLGTPEGVPDNQIRRAIAHGIAKINTDTDIRLAFTAAIRQQLSTKRHLFDPRDVLAPARDLMQRVVEHRIKLFGSAGKA